MKMTLLSAAILFTTVRASAASFIYTPYSYELGSTTSMPAVAIMIAAQDNLCASLEDAPLDADVTFIALRAANENYSGAFYAADRLHFEHSSDNHHQALVMHHRAANETAQTSSTGVVFLAPSDVASRKPLTGQLALAFTGGSMEFRFEAQYCPALTAYLEG